MKQIKQAITNFGLTLLPNFIFAIEPGETAQKFNIVNAPIIYFLLAVFIVLGIFFYLRTKK